MTLTLNKGFWSPGGGGGGSDPLWDSVALLLTGTEQLGSSSISFTGLTTTTSGKFGDGYISDSSNIVAGNSALIPATDVFSIEFWLNFRSRNSYGGVFNQYAGGAGRMVLQTPVSGVLSRLDIQVGGVQATASVANGIANDTWVWIQIIRATSGASAPIKIYQDGSETINFTTMTESIAQHNFRIGAGDSTAGTYPSDILFDDFRVTYAERTDFTVPTGPLPTS